MLTVLHGVGGVGKTRLALEVARRARTDGRRVWWVQAPDTATFEAAMQAVGYAAGAPPDAYTQASPADVVWQALENHNGRWLLVIDNLDDPTILAQQGPIVEGRGWIRPPPRQGALLITSRDGRPAAWAHWIHRQPVGPLNPEAAAQVLLDLAPNAGTKDEATQLGQHLSGIPLLLHLAGFTLAKASDLPASWATPGTLRSFLDYRHALTADHTYLTGPRADKQPEHVDDLDLLFRRTWEISLGQLKKTDLSHARNLLLLVCCFAEAPFPYEIVLQPSALAETELFSGVTAIELIQSLRGLNDLGLITLIPTDTTRPAVLLIHPVIRTAARSHPDLTHDTSATYWNIATDLLIDTAQQINDGPEGARTWSRLSAHAAETFMHSSDQTEHDSWWSSYRLQNVLETGARQLASHGLHGQALALYDALISKEADPTDEYRIPRARMLCEMGRHAEALTEFDAVLAAQRELHGDQHADVLSTRHERAWVLAQLGRHAEALTEFDAVLTARQQLHGTDHPLTIRSATAIQIAIKEEVDRKRG